MRKKHRILSEVLLVYIVVIGLIVGLYQIRGLPLVNQYLWTLAMLMQVYVPAWMLHQHQTLAIYGLHLQQWRRNLMLWMLACLVVLPPSAYGHHIWQKFNGREFRPQQLSAKQFSYELRGAPPESQTNNRIQIYAGRQQPIITIRWTEPLRGTLSSDQPLQVFAGNNWIRGATTGKVLKLSGGKVNAPASVQLRIQGSYLRFKLYRDGQRIPLDDVRLGPSQEPTSKNTISKGWFWLLYLIIAQCLMVALPEELFYRGYMQTRLDSVFPVKEVWGIPISWGNLIVSILFALTHFLIGFEPHRLSVFFPSLLFGALKHRTNSLLAPILFHASANIFVKILELGYA